ncbi:Putative PRIP-interacting protein [Cavenderia fasciculata]|uniref:Trimethylguanosine synthase n=1 Tax=Cavenderia fasciculata TaxID=261658 RepID=F4QD12_CACFS|nr:Putative PRIP-interacting protein [Cavenderia fasciculata]EGG13693.1 Putative PRIP-interacting protein [Cavenderia fasciculata]|eukprot:XP_004350397.1 Putative PRIP-interacting protein [Cavenderia fasciculata]
MSTTTTTTTNTDIPTTASTTTTTKIEAKITKLNSIMNDQNIKLAKRKRAKKKLTALTCKNNSKVEKTPNTNNNSTSTKETKTSAAAVIKYVEEIPIPKSLILKLIDDYDPTGGPKRKFRLFSKYDQGILMDDESWYSVTPEKIAKHIAERCRCDFIIDGFGGAGGNSIQFARTCGHVLAVDLDPTKVQLAINNANVYRCVEKIDFINGNFMDVARSIQGITHVDVIFLSPPWGGPSYRDKSLTQLSDFTPDGFDIFRAALKITPNIVYYLPNNIDHLDLAKLTAMSRSYGGTDHCEVEENYINDFVKTITVYFGNTIRNFNPSNEE